MADAPADAGAAPKKGKKKLIIIIAVALLVVLAGGGAAVFMMKKKADAAAAEEEEGGSAATASPHSKVDPAKAPTFVPLDPFVVNLADKDSDKFAQIGVILQVDDPKFADQMKTFMPAIRNGILMILAHKTSEELLSRAGKEALASEIMREAVRPMGIEITPVAEVVEEEEEDPPVKKKKKKKPAPVHNPVEKVHFSNFIVQ